MPQQYSGLFALLLCAFFAGCATTYVDPKLTVRDTDKIAILEPRHDYGSNFYITEINGKHRGIGFFNRFELAPGLVSITAVPNPSLYSGSPLTVSFRAEAGKKYYFIPEIYWEQRRWKFSIIEHFEWAKQNQDKNLVAPTTPAPATTEAATADTNLESPGRPETVTIESSTAKPESSTEPEVITIDLSGTYTSEITAGSHWTFRGRYRNLEVSIVQNEAGDLQLTTSPKIELSGKIEGNRVLFKTGGDTYGCHCAFIDGTWEPDSGGQRLAGNWTKDGGGKGTWNLVKIR